MVDGVVAEDGSGKAHIEADTPEESSRGRLKGGAALGAARGQLSQEHQRRASCALQRGNTRTIIGKSRRRHCRPET